MINLSILGSTGSIGTQTLDIVDSYNEEINVLGISGNNNINLLERQITKYKPEICCVMNKEKYEMLKSRISSHTKLVYGIDGLIKVATYHKADTVLTAVSGIIGLEPTIEAIKTGKRIALANKETLVTGGSIINKLVEKYNTQILPVDSEHSAIFQCLQGNENNPISKILLTASGGPFLGKNKKELQSVTLKEALNHPNWSMGKKITIDSATLMNKGLEMIEAVWLFNVSHNQVEIVIHPESIIHSAVEFIDKSIIAQMGLPDMRLPILYALFYPKRKESDFKSLDLFQIKSLNFLKPDRKTFKSLDLAYEAIKTGGSMPTVLNVANEIAVDKFLKNKIGFLDIINSIERLMEKHKSYEVNNLQDILYAKEWTEKKFNEL